MIRIDQIVIVGAGAAGLTCARALHAAGLAAVVLEATADIGGRIRSVTTASGSVWELGAQVLHGTANPATALLDSQTDGSSFRDSDFRILLDGTATSLAACARRGVVPWTLADRIAAAPAQEVRETVQAWLSRAVSESPARSVGDCWLQAEWAIDPARLDAAELARWVRRRGPAVTEMVVTAGMSRLVDRLAAGLSVHRSTPVRRVALAVNSVRVRTDHDELLAPAVVITVPPWTVRAGELQIADIRDDRPRAISTLHGGDAVVAVIETDLPAPASMSVLDASTPSGFLRCVAGHSGVQLVAKGAGARRLRELLAHPAALVELVRAALPWTVDTGFGQILRADWGAERFQRGAFSTPGRGSSAARSAWRTPIDRRIFFAGEATCDPAGLARVHGAMDSGAAAARAVQQALAGTAAVA